MVTRNLRCPECGHRCERTALGMAEPSHDCPFCDNEMVSEPAFPAGVKFIGEGFHEVDYPKSAEQRAKEYGYHDRLSTTGDGEGYLDDDPLPD